MALKLFKYFFLSLGMQLLLAGVEIFLLRPVIDMISFSYWVRFTIYLILLILINPVIVRLLLNRSKLANLIDADRDEPKYSKRH